MSTKTHSQAIRKSFTAGYFSNVAKRNRKGYYETLLDGQSVYIHPSSALFGKKPSYIIYNEIVFTNKEYLRDVSIINPQWLLETAPALYRPIDHNDYMDPLDTMRNLS